MFGGALGLIFTKRYDDDESWLSIRPDRQRYDRIQEEMAERVLTGYEPPRHRRKDDSDVHPLIRYAVRVGIPTALCCVFAWWILSELSQNQKASIELQRTSIEMQQSHAASTTALAEQATRTERLMERFVALAAVACGQGAKTGAEMKECERASR